MSGEVAALALNTLHNLTFYLDTMGRIRDAIAFRTFDSFRRDFLRSVSSLAVES
jgi:tRNA-guanine family transglycosylase